MNADNLDIRLLRFRSRRDEYPLALATALLEAGRIPEALEVVQVGLVQSENDGALLVLEGRAWFEQGDLPQAQAALLRAAKASPRDKEPYRWLAQVLMKRGEPARAVQVLERALQIDPTDRGLQQAHMRAQRLSRIASEADEPVAQPAARSAPAPQNTASASSSRGSSASSGRVTERPRSSAAPQQAKPLPIPPPPAAPKLPPPPRPSAASSSSAIHAKVEARQPFDPVPDTAPPLELSRPLPPRAPSLDGDGDESDDEPTLAAELPEELRSWLDAERSSHTPEPVLTRSNNDNAAHAHATPANDWARTFEDDSQPTLSVDSAELNGLASNELQLAGEEPVNMFVSESLAGVEAQVAPSFEDAQPLDRAAPAEPEPPEQVLELLEQQRIFERRGAPVDDATWVPKGQTTRAGNRIGRSLAVGWLLALCAAGGGYYGFTRYLEHRRGDAKSLIAQAQRELHDGQYESLLSAERHLIEARNLDPKTPAAVESLLFVHATRAIEDASGEMGYLRNSLGRAREKQVSRALVTASESLLAAYDGDSAAARSKSEAALQAGREDARILYLVGRLYQRAGLPEASALLESASKLDASLSLAFQALGELAVQSGDREGAKKLFTRALGEDGKQLRAELWTIVVDTDATQAAQLKTKLGGMAKRIEHGSASDKLLAASAQAGIALALGDVEGARAAVREGGKLQGVRAPELTALFAERALEVGELSLAYQAASSTLRAAPNVRSYRDTLVKVLLKRGDGRAVLSTLEGVEGNGALQVVRAQAALLVGARDVLDQAKRDLTAHRAGEGKEDPDVAALLMRVDLRLGANGESLLPAARSLAQRAQDRAMPQLALAEAALSAHQAAPALAALDKARALTPDDADVYYLSGRAQRLSGKITDAEASFSKALQIAPGHLDARESLASLLLDGGQYDRAHDLYSALERDGGGLSASLGATEALLLRGDVIAAEKRLGRLEGDDFKAPGTQLLRARVMLAKGRAGEAVKLLDPLAREESEVRSADVLALLGDALYADERVDSAAGAYDDALELDASHPDALVGRAMAALRAEKTSQANDLAQRADASLRARVRPPQVRATLLLLQAKIDLLKQGYTSAREKLAKAVVLPGVPAEAHFWYAETLSKTKSAGASDSYAKYLEVAPTGYYASRAKKALAPR